ncbi:MULTISPECIES: hypothetical protein [Brevibacillus]|uniref:hypothetical protein n=1 Tax=Brevibacillus TaxID=55080 RepID=UPI000EC04C45|nr:hypothetical protein [Brevibacillus sp.]HBZ83235.1 hypothetical protein [Brevibacillus sp.]
MEKLQYEFQTLRVQSLDSVLYLKTLISQGALGISGYSIFSGDAISHEICLPTLLQVYSEGEIISYFKQLSETHLVTPNEITLTAEVLPNIKHLEYPEVENSIVITISEEQHFLAPSYLPEHRETLIKGIARLGKAELEKYIGEFIDQRFSLMLRVDEGEEFYISDFKIHINCDIKQIEEIKLHFNNHFEYIHNQCKNGFIEFYYHSKEGPFVYTICDIIWVTMEFFGPRITSILSNLGIRDYNIVFTVDEFN